MKQYRQFCSVARALDVVGDRWALLVVRELLLGPRRYTDLIEGLPGIGSNVLATRLRELEENGLIVRRQLPPPTPAALYELTDDGRALRPALHELAKWGTRRLGTPEDGDVVRPAWFVLAMAGSLDRSALNPGDTYTLRVGHETFGVAVGDDGVAASTGRPHNPVAVITADLASLFRLASGRQTLTALRRRRAITVQGDQAAGQRLLEAIEGLHWAGPAASPTPQPARSGQLAGEG